MLKRNTLSARALFALMFSTLCLASAAGAVQKTPIEVSGAPLKGVDINLSRYGGAQFSGSGLTAFRAKTNEKGEWTLGKVPEGKYDLTLTLPDDPKDTRGYATATSDLQGQINDLRLAVRITIDGVKSGPTKKDLAFKQEKAADSRLSVGRPKFENIVFTIETDGKSEIKGTLTQAATPSGFK